MQNESQNIEYKESWRDEYLKWICGFANAQGGTIYIGVNDSKEIVGIEDSKRLREDIPNKVRDVLGIIVDVNLLKQDGNEYIEITVPAYSNPINYKGQYHYRSGSTKQELKGNALTRFLLQKGGTRWDAYLQNDVTVSDLSDAAFDRFRNQAAKHHRVNDDVMNESNETILQNLHLIGSTESQLMRAAVLLFHPDPEKFVFGAFVKIGYFEGADDALAFQDEVHGPLMLQVDKVLDLLTTKYTHRAISYEQGHRIETPQYPNDVLRELVLNAIAHKDYSTGIPIQISVYPDHIVCWNSGQLPENWTIQKLFEKHSSEPFSPAIAQAFFRAGDIESWGRGYRRIATLMTQANLLPPLIDTDSGLTITLYNNPQTQMQAMGLTERQRQVVGYVLSHNRVTNSEVQTLCKVSKPTATRLLSDLDTLLVQNGNRGKGTYYEIRTFK